MKRDSGFTVVEFLVAIAMVAILSSIAIPSYISWRSAAKLKEAVNLVWSDLERAKSHAVRRNKFVAIVFSADGYTIFVDDGSGGATAGNWNHETGEEFLTHRKMPAGVQIDLVNTTFDNDRTGFNGRGWIGNTGKVTLQNSNGDQKVVSIENRFGRITTD